MHIIKHMRKPKETNSQAFTILDLSVRFTSPASQKGCLSCLLFIGASPQDQPASGQEYKKQKKIKKTESCWSTWDYPSHSEFPVNHIVSQLIPLLFWVVSVKWIHHYIICIYVLLLSIIIFKNEVRSFVYAHTQQHILVYLGLHSATLGTAVRSLV